MQGFKRSSMFKSVGVAVPHTHSFSLSKYPSNKWEHRPRHYKIITCKTEWWWWWIVFVVWLTDERRLVPAFLPAGTRISDTPRAGFEPAQNLGSGLVEWSCAVVITTTPRRHKVQLKKNETSYYESRFQYF